MSEQLNIPLSVDTSGVQRGADQAANIVKGFVIDAQREVAKIGNQKVSIQLTLEGAKAERDLQKIEKQTQKTTAAIKQTTVAQKLFGKQTSVTQGQVKRSISTLQRMAQAHKAGTAARRRANASLQAMQQRLSALKSVNGAGVFQRMGNAMGGLSGQFALGAIKAQLVMRAFQMLKDAVIATGAAMIQRAKDVQGLRLALSGFLQTEQQVNDVMKSSKAIALSYGGSIKEVDAAYKRLTPTILAAGGSIQDVEQVIIAMTARTTQLGLSGEQTGRYMEAVAQIMGKGKLQAEELTKQLSQLDGALRSQIAGYLETEHGITDMYKAMQQGEVTADMFREAFVAASQETAAAMKRDMNSVQKIIGGTRNGIETTIAMIENRINNLNTLSLDSLNQTFSGLGEAVLRIRAGFAQFFSSITTNMPATQQMFQKLFDTLGVIAELLVNGFLNGLRLIFQAFEYGVRGAQMFINKLKEMMPFLDPLIKWTQRIGGLFMTEFRKGTDELNKLGPTATKQIGFLEQMGDSIKQGPVLSAEELNKKLEELAPRGIQAQQEYLAKYMEGVEAQKESADEIKEKSLEAIGQQIEKLNEMQEERNKHFDQQIQNIDGEIAKHREKMSEIRDNANEELDLQKEIYNEKIAAIDAEIGKLREKTPMEKKLRDMQKQELRDKIASGELSGKELVAAQARLERMQRQDEINEKLLEKQELKTQHAEDQKKIQDELNKALQPYKDKIDELEKRQEKIADDKEREKSATEEAIGYLENAAGIQGQTAESVKKQQAYAQQLAGNYNAASGQAQSLASAIDRAAAAQRRLNRAIAEQPRRGGGGSAPTTSNFAGGPISAGTTSWVNELGKEAFLSASGRLSMINDTHGKWTAPSDGTIIPAHLTKELGKIPGGGINLNKAAGANAMSTGGNMHSMVRAIKGAISGDTFNQNLTVQAVNPVQAANNMMVEMTRLRRRRFG